VSKENEEKSENKFTIRKIPAKINNNSRLSLVQSQGKSGVGSQTTINEDEANEANEKKSEVVENSVRTLETMKNNTSPSPVRTKTQSAFIKSRRQNWRERIESSLLEADEFLKQESSEQENPLIENILKKYGVVIFINLYLSCNRHHISSNLQ